MSGGFTQRDSGVKPVISRAGTRAETRVMELLSSELGTFTTDIDIRIKSASDFSTNRIMGYTKSEYRTRYQRAAGKGKTLSHVECRK